MKGLHNLTLHPEENGLLKFKIQVQILDLAWLLKMCFCRSTATLFITPPECKPCSYYVGGGHHK